MSYFNNSIKLGQKSSHPIIFLEQAIYLKRTWHDDKEPFYDLQLHAKFNSSGMNGVFLKAFLNRNGDLCGSNINLFRLYRVSDSDWSETLVTSAAPVSSGGVFTLAVNQTTFGSNELSGAETYVFECEAFRRRRKFKKRIYFNHLGCFDSINRLRQYADQLNILKVDE